MAAQPECVLFALDTDPEVKVEASRGLSRLDVLKQSILTIAAAKKRVNSQHVFCLAVLKDVAQLVLGHTGSLDALAGALNSVQPAAESSKQFNLNSIADVVETVEARVAAAAYNAGAPPSHFKVRVLLLYCRSSTVPKWTRRRPLPIDALYIHDRPTPGVNCPQEVFNALEAACDTLSHDAGHHAYILECNATNIKKWLNVMVLTVAHAAHRTPQLQLPSLTPPEISGQGPTLTPMAPNRTSDTGTPAQPLAHAFSTGSLSPWGLSR